MVQSNQHDYAGCVDDKCISCNHWKGLIKNPEALVDAKFECFTDGGKKPAGTKYLGHAGRVFIIQKGEERIVTNNLWCAGYVPEFFRPQLPINCSIESGKYMDLLK